MNFISAQYLVLLSVSISAYFLLPHRFRWILLLASSCIFYAAYIPAYLLILFLLILIDYFTGLRIADSSHKKRWLLISIVSNLALLGFFKYYNFFAHNLNFVTGASFPLHQYLLPIGLSFHTFQSMSYTIEVYRGNIRPERHLGIYALYILFFPQLVAGPIERPQHMLPQFRQRGYFSFENLYKGIQLIVFGMFKKVVIADRLSDYVDAAYQYTDLLNGTQSILAIFMFSVQIYADFSGYSDIARGSAKCLGFNLSINFNNPYLSSSISEFWNRWHISLYTWFKDYVYIPLGGNRKGNFLTIRNYFITFSLSGLWHGAAFHFILWGILQAFLITFQKSLELAFPRFRLLPVISIIFTFAIVSMAWVFFRAADFNQALSMFRIAFQFSPSEITQWKLPVITTVPYGNYSLAFVTLCIIGMFYLDKSVIVHEKKDQDPMHWVSFTIVALTILFFGIFNTKSFIYFQF
jgi:alginate O-acetyltransferase complex protein AlgI